MLVIPSQRVRVQGTQVWGKMLFLLVGTSGSTVARRVQTGSFLVKALRSFAILIGFLVMSMDPHGKLDTEHGAVTDLVCDESEGMSPAARTLTDSSGAPVALPQADAPFFALDAAPQERAAACLHQGSMCW